MPYSQDIQLNLNFRQAWSIILFYINISHVMFKFKTEVFLKQKFKFKKNTLYLAASFCNPVAQEEWTQCTNDPFLCACLIDTLHFQYLAHNQSSYLQIVSSTLFCLSFVSRLRSRSVSHLPAVPHSSL